MGAETGKMFLSYNGEAWLACPGEKNPYNGKMQYSGKTTPPFSVFFP